MTWSYSGDPGASSLDELRFILGDTDESDQQLSDEELLFLLREHGGSAPTAAIGACRRLVAKYTRCVDQKTGDIDIKYSSRVSQYEQLLAHLRAGLVPTPYAGGISKADIETVQDDDDRQGPIFALGMFDNPSDDPQQSGGTGGVI